MVDAFYSKHKANLTLGLTIAVVVAVVSFAAIAIFADKTDAPAPPKPVALATPNAPQIRTQHFGNWTLACGQASQKKGEDCALVFNAVDKTRKHLLMRLSVVQTTKGPAMLVMAPPTDKKSAGFTLAPDKGVSVTLPYTRCAPGICETGFTINDAMRTALTTSEGAQVKFVAGTQPLSFRIPLIGFPQGYAAWSARQPKGSLAAPHEKAVTPAGRSTNGH